MPGTGSWLVHIDDDRRPLDADGLAADDEVLGVNTLGPERLDESSPLGGYPDVADFGVPKPDEPLDGVEGASLDGDDGVVHTESRELESLGA